MPAEGFWYTPASASMINKFDLQVCRLLIRVVPIAFCLAGPAAMAGGSPSGEIFRASFENGFAAELAGGAAEPVQTGNLQTVPGVRGKGVLIPADGTLDYELTGNLSAGAGTLSMWVKPNWSVEGTGTWLDRPAAGEAYYKTGRRYFSAGVRHQACQDAWLHYLPNKDYAAIKRIFAGAWLHLVFAWDAAADESVFYINGIFVEISGGLGRALGKRLQFGSVSDVLFGLDGVLDEVRIYDRVLDAAAVQALYAEAFPLALAPYDFAGLAEKPGNFRVRLVNLAGAARQAEYTFRITAAAADQFCAATRLTANLAAGATRVFDLPFTPPAAGDYRVAAETDGRTQRIWEIAAILPENQTGGMPVSDPGATRTTLLREIDCTQELPAEQYADDGACRLVDSSCGRYRETTLRKTNAGFAYRADILNPGRPHWIEIDYPDNADRMFSLVIYPRAMYPAAPTCDRYLPGGSLDTLGILTGGTRPLSGARQTKRLLFWPDSREIMIGCFAYGHPDAGGPAAMRLRIYENAGPLPRLAVNPPADLPARVLGIWEEDPTMAGLNWFNRPECYRRADYDFWRIKTARMVEYARYCGKNQWSLLLLDYHGDNCSAFEYVLPGSRNAAAYGRIPGWADVAAAVFEREQMPFLIALNQRNHLAGHSDHKEFGALALVIGSHKLSPDFAAAAARGEAAPEQFTAENGLGGMRNGEGGWALDPLHPEVQAGYLRLIRAYRDKFGKYSQFSGINLISPAQLDYAGPASGYGDNTVNRFVRETGTPLPSISGPERFAARWQWLQTNAWEQWLDWRCASIAGFYTEMLRELNTGLNGKRLVIRLLPGRNNPVAAALAQGAKPGISLDEFWRERGIDQVRLGRIAGLQVLTEVRPNYSEVHPESVDERYYTFSPAVSDFLQMAGNPGVLLHQHSNLEVYWSIAKSPIKQFWRPAGGCVYNDLILSHYATPQPINRYTLESIAWVLAESDAQYIDHGFWGCPENGALEVYQPFHQAFLSLPQLRFARFGGGDPVTLRFHESPAGHWFYMINKADYPVRIKLGINPENAQIADAARNLPICLRVADGQAWLERELPGYGVLVGQCPEPLRILTWEQAPPETVKAELAARLLRLAGMLGQYAEIYGARPGDAANMLEQAQAAAAEGRLTQADYRLQSRAIRRLGRELAGNLRQALIPGGGLRLEFRNIHDFPVSGKIKLRDWPGKYGWQPELTEREFVNLPAGETFAFVFPFAAAAFHHRAQHDFDVELAVNGNAAVTRHLRFFPYLARWSAAMPRIDGRLDDWGKETIWHTWSGDGDHAGNPAGAASGSDRQFDEARWAGRWNESGLALAVVIQEPDGVPNHAGDRPGGIEGWRVFFDQYGSRLPPGAGSLIYQVGPADGGILVRREQAPAGQNPGIAPAVPAAVVREMNTASYEVFFPAAEFTRVKFTPSLNLGFSLMVNTRGVLNQRRTDKPALAPDAAASHPPACAWIDLILTHTLPGRAEVSVSGAGELAPVSAGSGTLTRNEPRQANEPGEHGQSLTFTSHLLAGEWREYSFTFIACTGGNFRLALTGEWAPADHPAPLVQYRDVQVSGAAAPAPELRQWQNYNSPEIREEGGAPVAMVSRHQPLFVDLEAASRGLVEVRFSACQGE